VTILSGIKEKYEIFHQLKYTDEALAGFRLPIEPLHPGPVPADKAIDIIDEAGARVKLRTTSVPEEMVNIQRRIRVIDGRIENAISAQEFEKSSPVPLEEDMEQENLQVIRERWKLKTTTPLKVTREDVEEVIAKWTEFRCPPFMKRKCRNSCGWRRSFTSAS